jgi:predicted MPP superfamily phosphohydrolase
MISRRLFLQAFVAALAASSATAAYAVVVEPRFRLAVTHYRVSLPGWPAGGRPVRLVLLADIHACEPWMPAARIAAIVEAANALQPDLALLGGDYVAGMRRFKTADVPPAVWAGALAQLRAPLGTFAVLGNHDHYGGAAVGCRAAFADAGVPVLENRALRLAAPDAPAFWLAGLGDQLAHADDLAGTLRQVDGAEPVVLLAHEPDIFPVVPERVALTLCGHTHGGQVVLPFVGPVIVPSRYGTRYAYGHFEEAGRQMIVSGGLGCSIAPLRFGRPPEIVAIDLVSADQA